MRLDRLVTWQSCMAADKSLRTASENLWAPEAKLDWGVLKSSFDNKQELSLYPHL